MKNSDLRQQLIRIFTLLGGVYFFLEYVLPETVLETIGVKDSHEAISNGFIVIGVMAVGLGIFNLINIHGSRIAFRREGWINSAALLGGLAAMMMVTIGTWTQGLSISYEIREVQMLSDFARKISTDAAASRTDVPPLSVRIGSLVTATSKEVGSIKSKRDKLVGAGFSATALITDLDAAVGACETQLASLGALQNSSNQDDVTASLGKFASATNGIAVAYGTVLRKASESNLVQQSYDLLYDGLFIPLGSAMFALLGVYIASAAYRAFRVRSLESALMMSAAVLVMLGQISFGVWIYKGLPDIRQWLLEVPNSAAFRAIRLGASIAGLMLAIRMWLSIESSSFSRKEK